MTLRPSISHGLERKQRPTVLGVTLLLYTYQVIRSGDFP